ncbi:hypothetical protein NDU88_002189 [Pleurodeles waltl]|uniref:Uncharacterized protein n=1 Tax=Pleurodeles waltl TaxID=8319 RepID=A0AAV7TK32_PLEWA|nr:hypothetical protein NDU88_002189 [Pleurodeles waltl]
MAVGPFYILAPRCAVLGLLEQSSLLRVFFRLLFPVISASVPQGGCLCYLYLSFSPLHRHCSAALPGSRAHQWGDTPGDSPSVIPLWRPDCGAAVRTPCVPRVAVHGVRPCAQEREGGLSLRFGPPPLSAAIFTALGLVKGREGPSAPTLSTRRIHRGSHQVRRAGPYLLVRGGRCRPGAAPIRGPVRLLAASSGPRC